MDEAYEQLTRFFSALKEFDEHLHRSVSEMARHHDSVSPLWQDEFRRQYDAEWQQFVDLMARYLNQAAPAYEEFLSEKVIALRRYLYGN